MREIDTSRWIGVLVAEDLACFVGRCLPVLLARQSHDYYLQLKTLILLCALEERLQACSSRTRRADYAELTESCERLSQHIATALACLPRARQLEYREILKLYELAGHVPPLEGGSHRDGEGC